MAKRTRRANRTGRSEGEPRHIRLEYWLLRHDSYLALSANAKVTMMFMAMRFNGFNNGQIGFGWRAGCLEQISGTEGREKSFGLSRHQIGRALDELEGAGFIVCTKSATFDQKRMTREWRLTWLPSGLHGEGPPTREFASIPPARKLKARCTGASNPPLQVHQHTYSDQGECEKGEYRCTSAPIANSHRCTSAPHISYQGAGGDARAAAAMAEATEQAPKAIRTGRTAAVISIKTHLGPLASFMIQPPSPAETYDRVPRLASVTILPTRPAFSAALKQTGAM